MNQWPESQGLKRSNFKRQHKKVVKFDSLKKSEASSVRETIGKGQNEAVSLEL